MSRYVARRIGTVIPLLFVASILIFSMVRLMPGDAAVNLLPPDASPDQVEALREELGLNEPFLTQYVSWMGGLLQGDFGESLSRGAPIGPQIARAAGVTVQLAIAGLGLALVVAIPLGFAAGLRPGGWSSRFLEGFTTVAFAVPNFWLGILLILLFAVYLGWLPTSGFVSITEDPVEALLKLVLPAVTLAMTQAAVLASFLRSSVERVRGSEFIKAAVANGLPRRSVRYRHVLRNALIPVVTVAALIFGRLLGGAVIVETLFSIPGLGRLLVSAISTRDFPVIQGVLILIVAGFAVLNLLTDLVYGRLDPRIRLK